MSKNSLALAVLLIVSCSFGTASASQGLKEIPGKVVAALGSYYGAINGKIWAQPQATGFRAFLLALKRHKLVLSGAVVVPALAVIGWKLYENYAPMLKEYKEVDTE